MSEEKFIEILQKCYFGDRDAFNEIVAVFKEVTYDCDALLQEREILWKTVRNSTNNSSKLSKKLSRTEKKNKRLQEENKELKKQLRIKHDGFMASIEEKCELVEENQKMKLEEMKIYKEILSKYKEIIGEKDE